MIRSRDNKWELIRPVIQEYEQSAQIDFTAIEKMAIVRAGEIGASKGSMLDAVHRYFAFGCIKNALLPNYAACGAPTMPRLAQGKKQGRKNAAALIGNSVLEGKILTEEDRQNLSDGWSMYVRPVQLLLRLIEQQ